MALPVISPSQGMVREKLHHNLFFPFGNDSIKEKVKRHFPTEFTNSAGMCLMAPFYMTSTWQPMCDLEQECTSSEHQFLIPKSYHKASL